MGKLSEFFAQNSQKLIEWMHPPKTRLEKFGSVLNSQLFLLAAALLIYRAEIVTRIASWTVMCIFEGIVLIFSALLLKNVDLNHKWILRVWPYISLSFELAIVIVVNVQDTADEIPTVISFLLFPAICESASLLACIALMAYGVIMLNINKFDNPHLYCIIVSIINIFCCIGLRLVVLYQKLAGPEFMKRTKTLAKGKPEAKPPLLGGSTEEKEKSISSVKPATNTKIKKVVPIYGNNAKVSSEDDIGSFRF